MVKWLIRISCVCVFSAAIAQDSHYSQFYSNPTYLNPAMAGSSGSGRMATNYRLQFPSILCGTQATSFSYDHYLIKSHTGLGFSYDRYNEGMGTYLTTNFNLIYARHFRLVKNKLYLSIGGQASLHEKNLDWSKLNFSDQIDIHNPGFIWNTNEIPPEYPIQRISAVDASAGMMLYSKRMNLGFAAHHINQPNEGMLGQSKLAVKFTTHGSYTFGKIEDGIERSITASFLINKQAIFKEYIFGVSTRYTHYNLGVSYRINDALIFAAAYQLKNMRLGYSYDLTTSTLYNTGGAHEISLQVFLSRTLKDNDRLTSTPISF